MGAASYFEALQQGDALMESEQADVLGLDYLNVDAQMGETLVRVVVDQDEQRVTVFEDDNTIIWSKTYEA